MTLLRLTLLTMLAGLAACAASPPPATSTGSLPTPGFSPGPVQTPEHLQASAVARAAVAPAADTTHTTLDKPDAVSNPNEVWVVKFLLGYAEYLRALNPSELAAEIAALGEPGSLPMGQMQLALALTHTHQPVDTARALGLYQRVIAQEQTVALPYKPLARILVARLLDQRKLEDTVDRQNQQLREQQRRIDQLTERLEAMRAIERSLNPRPGSSPGVRPRPAPSK